MTDANNDLPAASRICLPRLVHEAAAGGDGFADEQPKLRAASIAFAISLDDKATLSAMGAGVWDKIIDRFRWPGTKWIPSIG